MNWLKKVSVIILAVTALATAISSCVKDRIQPAVIITPPPVDTTGTDTTGSDTSSATLQLLDYWDFNSSDTVQMLIANPSFSGATITYDAAYYDAVSPGSAFNLRNGADSGNGLRMRNPFNSLTFNMPTTGYKNAVLTFSTEKSSKGPIANNIYYTIDGTNFINDSLSITSITLDTVWTQSAINFSGIKRVNNNPKFAIRLITGDNNTGASGNDRYDNVTLEAYKQ